MQTFQCTLGLGILHWLRLNTILQTERADSQHSESAAHVQPQCQLAHLRTFLLFHLTSMTPDIYK